ncbi:hypothetical protein [Micromonospora sp. Llam0]|uniref:hypothetical protein n=1 Tax=Micromonospora sp. Llam0 TaxID=2485143 RepID=UPI000F48CD41|nr:hypothetical protein [Micromonospora sp. Llam0]
MVDEPSRISTWTLRVVVYGGAVTGFALSAAAIVVDDAPLWWVLVGAPLAVCCGLLVFVWLRFRLRHRSPESRPRAVEAMAARRDTVGRPLERSRIAQRATRHKKAVLAAGVPTTAVVQFLASAHRASQFRHLVYLELEVVRPDGARYLVKTGEYLDASSAGSVAPGRVLQVKVDPVDPDRVAVDWERSLRLT